jgi:hypothetical protein
MKALKRLELTAFRGASRPLALDFHPSKPRVSKSQGILDRLLNLPNAAFVSVESACLAQ